jgi:MerR family transcriptional regulator, thiopeptide resistance regulator
MSTIRWTIGQLAKRTGVSVRALRHYDEIGLLSPAGRTESGYRLYVAEDIARLHRVKTLRQLGFSLLEIQELLDQAIGSPRQLVADHLRRLHEHIALEQRLCERLEGLTVRLSTAVNISSEEFLDLIEVMSMVENSEKYYTPEQLAWLQERAETVGAERIRQVEAEWPKLIAEVRTEMERGTDPREERVQHLAARWRGLVQEFSGGNPEIETSLRTMYAHEPQLRQHTGVQADMVEYITRALVANS